MTLADAGFGIRDAKPDDLPFVFKSWLDTGWAEFLDGDAVPWPYLEDTIQRARAQGNTKLLRRIWVSNVTADLRIWHSKSPPVVVFDLEQPTSIAAWTDGPHLYIKQAFRDRGLEDAMIEALEARE